MPTYISSAAKLDGLLKLFTSADNGKIDQGEVEALTGFFGGLKPASQSKIRAAMVDIYASATFSSGQKAKMYSALKQLGFTTAELEGSSGDVASDFLKLSKTAQFEKLLSIEQGNAGATKAVVVADIASAARAKIKTDQKDVQAAICKKHEDASFGDLELQALYTQANKTELVGYAVLLPIYADEHDVNRMYFYNLRGQRVGDDYRGE